MTKDLGENFQPGQDFYGINASKLRHGDGLRRP